VDGTIGGGGHAVEILRASCPDGFLFGCDLDAEAVRAARQRLAEFAGRFEIYQQNFAALGEKVSPESIDGALVDLGVSSWQLDRPERGFSFQYDGPLDMRMNTTQSLTAGQVINQFDEGELADIFREYGEERFSRRIAAAIVRQRARASFDTTLQLADFIAKTVPRKEKRIHPATRVFQAVRIRVNDELNSIRKGLDCLFRLLKEQGRLLVITFHSLEAAIVKTWSRELARDYVVKGEVDLPDFREPRDPLLRLITRKPVVPGEEEIRENPRARSAQLRIFEKLPCH
jgi:16S rRNA (cytosine1402-N4)-methyltransferase